VSERLSAYWLVLRAHLPRLTSFPAPAIALDTLLAEASLGVWHYLRTVIVTCSRACIRRLPAIGLRSDNHDELLFVMVRSGVSGPV